MLIIMNWAIEFPLVGYRETEKMVVDQGQVIARFCRGQQARGW